MNLFKRKQKNYFENELLTPREIALMVSTIGTSIPYDQIDKIPDGEVRKMVQKCKRLMAEADAWHFNNPDN